MYKQENGNGFATLIRNNVKDDSDHKFRMVIFL